MNGMDKDDRNLLSRLWTYQAERFPLGKTSLLLAIFSSASISFSAHISQRELPPIWIFVATWLVVVFVFFQLRACDEFKDLEDDKNYRPERPIPRGLVSLRLVLGLAGFAGGLAIILTWTIFPPLLFVLCLIWLWLGLMTFEFFVPNWLKRHHVLYLVSHMLIMPLIDLFITGAEWLPHANHPPAGLWLFLALSFANGCVLEMGRKIWAPTEERAGVETYSKIWGTRRSVIVWFFTSLFAFGLLVSVGLFVGMPFWVSLPGLIVLLLNGVVAIRFVGDPSRALQDRIDTLSGIWVFVCYASAGFTPYIVGNILS